VARVPRTGAGHRFNDVRKVANSLMFEVHDSIKDLPGATRAIAIFEADEHKTPFEIAAQAEAYSTSASAYSSLNNGDASFERKLELLREARSWYQKACAPGSSIPTRVPPIMLTTTKVKSHRNLASAIPNSQN
jgi:hypothetical protein